MPRGSFTRYEAMAGLVRVFGIEKEIRPETGGKSNGTPSRLVVVHDRYGTRRINSTFTNSEIFDYVCRGKCLLRFDFPVFLTQ